MTRPRAASLAGMPPKSVTRIAWSTDRRPRIADRLGIFSLCFGVEFEFRGNAVGIRTIGGADEEGRGAAGDSAEAEGDVALMISPSAPMTPMVGALFFLPFDFDEVVFFSEGKSKGFPSSSYLFSYFESIGSMTITEN